TCPTGGGPPTSGRSCWTSFRRRARSTRRRAPATSREEAGAGVAPGAAARRAAAPLFDAPLTGHGHRAPRPRRRSPPAPGLVISSLQPVLLGAPAVSDERRLSPAFIPASIRCGWVSVFSPKA